LTIKESLSNAVKHSGATEVSIQVRLDGPTLRALVEDNGHGFDPSQINTTRHGLSNMIARIKDLGGNCRVESKPGTGCRVAFSVPLPLARSERWVVKWWYGLSSR
jgi:signal transduction histidine kinase